MNKIIDDDGYIRMEVYLRGELVGIGKVDQKDGGIVRQHTWYINNNGYLITRVTRSRQVLLHRMIMGDNKDLDVDHVNMDKLDNRRSNLRWASRSENMMNNKAIGVSYDKQRGKWAPHIMLNYKKIYLGRFEKREDAILARTAAEIKYFGEFRNAKK